MVQLPLAATGVPALQVEPDWEKSPGLTPVKEMLVIFRAMVPGLASVTVAGGAEATPTF
jgi:hypothetical protein